MPTSPDVPSEELRAMALAVYKYARRWVVGMSPEACTPVVYDACITVLNDAFPDRPIGTTGTPSAVSDRYRRYGREPLTAGFVLPTTVEDAVVLLHRFARRYTNGRGTYTAALVNDVARELLAAGISLDETRDLDGTIWAADGAGGDCDGLGPDERAEAIGVLDRAPSPQAVEAVNLDPFGLLDLH